MTRSVQTGSYRSEPELDRKLPIVPGDQSITRDVAEPRSTVYTLQRPHLQHWLSVLDDLPSPSVSANGLRISPRMISGRGQDDFPEKITHPMPCCPSRSTRLAQRHD